MFDTKNSHVFKPGQNMNIQIECAYIVTRICDIFSGNIIKRLLETPVLVILYASFPENQKLKQIWPFTWTG